MLRVSLWAVCLCVLFSFTQFCFSLNSESHSRLLRLQWKLFLPTLLTHNPMLFNVLSFILTVIDFRVNVTLLTRWKVQGNKYQGTYKVSFFYHRDMVSFVGAREQFITVSTAHVKLAVSEHFWKHCIEKEYSLQIFIPNLFQIVLESLF